MKPHHIITLTTDFGTADAYVAAMKGVILSINARCTIVDITHQIAPQDIIAGSFALAGVYRYYPPGTIHVAVVDPGVGGCRAAIIIKTDRYFFIGPDNGIFSFILNGNTPKQIFKLTNQTYFLPRPAATFHGRDIFAPVAAHLSQGTPVDAFGPPLTDVVITALPEPRTCANNTVQGEIIRIDRFGNLITNLTRDMVEKMVAKGPVSAKIKKNTFSKILATYEQAGEDELFGIFGSSGFLEVSIKNGNAQTGTTAQKGTKITLKSTIYRTGQEPA